MQTWASVSQFQRLAEELRISPRSLPLPGWRGGRRWLPMTA